MKIKRVYHHYEKWECIGMYTEKLPEGINNDQAKILYSEFLKDSKRFKNAIDLVFNNWPISCEQFLTNQNINRIAWIGQASMFIETGIPRTFRAGFKLLSEKDQITANRVAEEKLNEWIKNKI